MVLNLTSLHWPMYFGLPIFNMFHSPWTSSNPWRTKNEICLLERYGIQYAAYRMKYSLMVLSRIRFSENWVRTISLGENSETYAFMSISIKWVRIRLCYLKDPVRRYHYLSIKCLLTVSWSVVNSGMGINIDTITENW